MTTMSKFVSRLANDRIMEIVTTNQWLSASQKAGKPHFRGCPTALMIDAEAIYDAGLWGKTLIMNYYDFSAAFDSTS